MTDTPKIKPGDWVQAMRDAHRRWIRQRVLFGRGYGDSGGPK